MGNFADRLIGAIRHKGNPCVVGLDPRIDDMPEFLTTPLHGLSLDDAIRRAITGFHELVIEQIAPLVPAVKPQVAFFEQYGLPGLHALADTMAAARNAGLMVIVDAKRNDISSTAEAYAHAWLGRGTAFGVGRAGFGGDALTVSPYLGRDSLEPFLAVCEEHGAGLFVLVKTSNAGSGDIQDVTGPDGRTVSARVAALVDELGGRLVGQSGYSSVGAVVGATYPAEAAELRALMPRAIVLVPGYGAQGGSGATAAANFNADGLGAVVSASRSVTYAYGDRDITEDDFTTWVRARTAAMVTDVTAAIATPVTS